MIMRWRRCGRSNSRAGKRGGGVKVEENGDLRSGTVAKKKKAGDRCRVSPPLLGSCRRPPLLRARSAHSPERPPPPSRVTKKRDRRRHRHRHQASALSPYSVREQVYLALAREKGQQGRTRRKAAPQKPRLTPALEWGKSPCDATLEHAPCQECKAPIKAAACAPRG